LAVKLLSQLRCFLEYFGNLFRFCMIDEIAPIHHIIFVW